jgi:nucleoid DNA-binding protein
VKTIVNRKDLIKILMEETGEYRYIIENIISHYESAITRLLLEDEEIRLHGFVTYKVKHSPGRRYKDAVTGEFKISSPTKKIKVEASERLDNLVKTK